MKFINKLLLSFWFVVLFGASVTNNNPIFINSEWIDKLSVEFFSALFLVCAVILYKQRKDRFGTFIVATTTILFFLFGTFQYSQSVIDTALYINVCIFVMLTIYSLYHETCGQRFLEYILFFVFLILLREVMELESDHVLLDVVQISILSVCAGTIIHTNPKDKLRVYTIAIALLYFSLYTIYISWIASDSLFSIFLHIGNITLLIHMSLSDLQ